MLQWKPKTAEVSEYDCKEEFNKLRECFIREKRIFRDQASKIDLEKPSTAIPAYLEK